MAFSFLYGPLSHLYMISGKTMDFASKIMSLLFNMLSTLVKAFLTRSKCLLISWLQSPSADFGAPKIKSLTVSPSICHEALGQDAIIFIFWMLSLGHHFYSPLSLSFKRQFNSSLSAIRVVSSVYLRLLAFLPEILIPACALSSLSFHMMYSSSC